jgi:hypothetical protein
MEACQGRGGCPRAWLTFGDALGWARVQRRARQRGWRLRRCWAVEPTAAGLGTLAGGWQSCGTARRPTPGGEHACGRSILPRTAFIYAAAAMTGPCDGGSGRLFACRGCGCAVIVCCRCDRGQIYCAGDCSAQGRRQTLRHAGWRWQRTRLGRLHDATPPTTPTHARHTTRPRRSLAFRRYAQSWLRGFSGFVRIVESSVSGFV